MSQLNTTFARAFDRALLTGALFAPKKTRTKQASKPAKTATAADLNSLGRPAQGPVDERGLKGALQAVGKAFAPALAALDRASKAFARQEARLRAEALRLARKAIAARRAAIRAREEAIVGSRPAAVPIPVEAIAGVWANALPRMARPAFARLIRAGQRLAGWAQSLSPGRRAWQEAMREESRIFACALLLA